MITVRKIYCLICVGSVVEAILAGRVWPDGFMDHNEELALTQALRKQIIPRLISVLPKKELHYSWAAEFQRSRHAEALIRCLLEREEVRIGPSESADAVCLGQDELEEWLRISRSERGAIKVALRFANTDPKLRAIETVFADQAKLVTNRIFTRIESGIDGHFAGVDIGGLPIVKKDEATVLAVLPDPFAWLLAQQILEPRPKELRFKKDGRKIRHKRFPGGHWIIEVQQEV